VLPEDIVIRQLLLREQPLRLQPELQVLRQAAAGLRGGLARGGGSGGRRRRGGPVLRCA
jgi:hypothetical protein